MDAKEFKRYSGTIATCDMSQQNYKCETKIADVYTAITIRDIFTSSLAFVHC